MTFSNRPAGAGGSLVRTRTSFGSKPKTGFKKSFTSASSDRTRSYSKDKPSFGDRPARSFSDRPARSFSDRPKRTFGDKPSFGDRPKFGDRPSRSFSDRPSYGGQRGGQRSFGGRSKFGGKGKSERIGFEQFIKPAEARTESIYQSNHTFSDFKFDKVIENNLAQKGYINPSPIQDQGIPVALSGRDLVGLANTGTGKTAAFLLPILQKILNDRSQKAIILAPTRELALQIEREFITLAMGTKIFSVTCVGGAPIFKQISNLRRGYSVVVGTPGRILDLVKRNVLDLSKINTIVLDEVDQMLDMGFVNDIEFVLGQMPKDRQSLFFSATMPKPIEILIQKYTNKPEIIAVKSRDTSANVDQNVVTIKRGEDKMTVLKELLASPDFEKVLIFAEMKHEVETLSQELFNHGFKSGSLHGDKRHSERQRTLFKFKNNELSILVATDVAARGLDIPNVSHVINYHIPKTFDTYVHRIGRTGRGDKTGKALTFVPKRG